MLGIGLAVGLFNGLVIVSLRVQPIVVTLAMYFILQGVDLLIAPNPVSVHSTGWLHAPGGLGGPDPRWPVHDRRAAADLVRTAVRSVSPAALRRRKQRRDGVLQRGQRQRGPRGELRARRVVRRHRRPRADRPGELDGRVQCHRVHACRDRGGRAGRHLAGRRPRRAGRCAARRVRDLPAAEPAGDLRDRPGLPADRLRRHAHRRRRARRCDAGGDRWRSRRTGAAAGWRRRKAAQPALAISGHLGTRRAASAGRERRRSRPAGRWPRRSASRSGRRLGAIQARFPVFQVLALAAVFIYGAISLPGLGQLEQHPLDPGARRAGRPGLRRARRC